MCRPPDLTPAAAGFETDGFDAYADDAVEEWNVDGNVNPGDFEGSEADVLSLLGKRAAENEARLADVVSRASKFPRAAAPVSSAFDSAAASFMAKMEQSMIQDLQRQQQQKSLAAEDVLIQRALAEQQANVQQLHQLQQLQLLKQLRAKQAQAQLQAGQGASIPALLAQQQLLQQAKLMSSLSNSNTAAAAQLRQSAAWASLSKPQASAAAGLFSGATPGQAAEAKIQAWMQSGLGSTPVTGVPVQVKAQLPILQPKAVAPMASAASFLGGAPPAGLFSMVLNDGSFGFGEEKKVKRMQSNRASAKRSRQRRQARLEELDKSTAELQSENTELCVKLEEAHQEINTLEEKNRSLAGEVSQLRKMLGFEGKLTKGKAYSDTGSPAFSVGHQQSCLDSEAGSLDVAMTQKNLVIKMEEESALEDNAGALDSLDWLSSIPLSPSAELSLKAESPVCGTMGLEDVPVLDQALVRGDVFSELLACFDG